MKKIMIAGSSSYIGSAVSKHLEETGCCKVTQIDTVGIEPEIIDFSNYDAVIMAAGIEPSKKTDKNPERYYQINRDLAYHTAIVAKAYGVKQFVVLSTLDVYGTDPVSVTAVSIAVPETDYAKSKYEADRKIAKLENDDFRVCIIRMPIVYGNEQSGIVGKFCKLFAGAPKRRIEKTHITRVCSLIEQIISDRTSGIIIATE